MAPSGSVEVNTIVASVAVVLPDGACSMIASGGVVSIVHVRLAAGDGVG